MKLCKIILSLILLDNIFKKKRSLVTGGVLEENGGDDFCIKNKMEHLFCKDSNVRSMAECHEVCLAGFEYCQLVKSEKTSCQSLILEEEKWMRKVSALETAIDIYMEKGYLHNDKQIKVAAGAAFCTTKYGTVLSESTFTELIWDDIALYPVDLQFDMVKPDLFKSADPTINIGQKTRYVLKFDGTHRMWFTMNGQDEIILPSMSSEPFKSEQIKSVKVESDGTSRSLRVPIPEEVRLRHGLFISLSMSNRGVRFTSKNYERMAASTDRQVKLFFNTHKIELGKMAAEKPDGHLLGLYRSLKPDRAKVCSRLGLILLLFFNKNMSKNIQIN